MTLLNLNKKLARIDRTQTGYTKRKRSKTGMLLKIIIVLLVVAIALYIPARGIYSSVQNLSTSAKLISAGAKAQNLDQIKQGVQDTKKSLASLNFNLNFFIWLKVIPVVGGYYSDSQKFASAASDELEAAEIVIKALEPHKNEVGLNGTPTPGQDRVAQAVKILDKLIPELDKIEPNLKSAREKVEDIDTSKYPEMYGSRKVRSNLENAKQFIVGAHLAVTLAKEALVVAPQALGANGTKTYLLMFQNDKELRATGGFITAYSFLKMDKGHLSTTGSDDIYRLDEKLLKVCINKVCPITPPEPIVRYLPEVDGKARQTWALRDSNLSPDFPTSMKDFERMYQLIGEGLPFDGIISIDTQVVEELINVTGPVEVLGTRYSSDKDPRCNCPNVIYELEKYAEVTAKGDADRKAVVGTLMQQILAQSLGADPQKLPDFITTGVRLLNHKHIQFYIHDQKTQAALSKLNWTGELARSQNGDYLHINDSNFAGGKSNLYVDESVSFDLDTKTKKVKLIVEYKNPQPFNIWLNGILRDYVRVYVPSGSKLTFSKGSDEPVRTKDDKDLNKTYFEAFVVVRPQNSRTLQLEYELPQNVLEDKNYSLLIQKQPGAKDHSYSVKVNGKTIEKFELDMDKTLQTSL